MSKTSQRKDSAFNRGLELFKEFNEKTKTAKKHNCPAGYLVPEYRRVLKLNSALYAGFQAAKNGAISGKRRKAILKRKLALA